VAAACVTVKATPAIAKVPVRGAVELLAATRYVTFPLPLPGEPLVTEIQGDAELAAALHAQPACVVTVAW